MEETQRGVAAHVANTGFVLRTVGPKIVNADARPTAFRKVGIVEEVSWCFGS